MPRCPVLLSRVAAPVVDAVEIREGGTALAVEVAGLKLGLVTRSRFTRVASLSLHLWGSSSAKSQDGPQPTRWLRPRKSLFDYSILGQERRGMKGLNP
jgi:hypothetical protein